uniref:Dynein light chain roadblock-type 2 n=1 Tax=Cacopsylla melanoneura TaxID=428564 RepID=A0A8D9FGJ1_9HEMI
MSLQKTNPSSLKVLRKEADAICQRFASFKNVIGTIVIDSEGLPFRSTFVKHEAFIYAEMGHQIASRALSGIEKINPEESVEMVKIITGSQEVPKINLNLHVLQH